MVADAVLDMFKRHKAALRIPASCKTRTARACVTLAGALWLRRGRDALPRERGRCQEEGFSGLSTTEGDMQTVQFGATLAGRSLPRSETDT